MRNAAAMLLTVAAVVATSLVAYGDDESCQRGSTTAALIPGGLGSSLGFGEGSFAPPAAPTPGPGVGYLDTMTHWEPAGPRVVRLAFKTETQGGVNNNPVLTLHILESIILPRVRWYARYVFLIPGICQPMGCSGNPPWSIAPAARKDCSSKAVLSESFSAALDPYKAHRLANWAYARYLCQTANTEAVWSKRILADIRYEVNVVDVQASPDYVIDVHDTPSFDASGKAQSVDITASLVATGTLLAENTVVPWTPLDRITGGPWEGKLDLGEYDVIDTPEALVQVSEAIADQTTLSIMQGLSVPVCTTPGVGLLDPSDNRQDLSADGEGSFFKGGILDSTYLGSIALDKATTYDEAPPTQTCKYEGTLRTCLRLWAYDPSFSSLATACAASKDCSDAPFPGEPGIFLLWNGATPPP